ncbi:hypothetical protein [Corynebacterium sputi]|uniref:hypothetical protein n=1 Tax=Corynebacterium sputi TaxID=489915 RepID=UPI0003FB3319|nr:hypothetical protein [Corynebacterium sputi]
MGVSQEATRLAQNRDKWCGIVHDDLFVLLLPEEPPMDDIEVAEVFVSRPDGD